MWRPFASDFVSHTYEDYRKKMDRIWSAKPIAKHDSKKEINSSLFPYQFAQGELDRRMKEFSELQVKVETQRKEIKKRDLLQENHFKRKINVQKKADELVKQERRISLMRIRDMAENKIRKHRSTRSQDYDYNYSDSINRTGFLTQKESLCKMSTFK